MRSITCRFTISAAHQLTGLREGHKCARMHGHNYIIDLTLKPKPQAPGSVEGLINGFVCDAEDVRAYVQPIISKIDHTVLNESLNDGTRAGEFASKQPTVEHLAMYLWERLGFLRNDPRFELANVRVYENERLWADWSAA